MVTSNRLLYSEVIKLPTFIERFDYLSLNGQVGEDTFGFERQLNQKFYKSQEWLKVRREIIIRDDGLDLASIGRPIFGKILIHHLNPLTPNEIRHHSHSLIDPENLICVSHKTHNAIHYGSKNLLPADHKPRRPGDTQLW